jgi:ADP-ribosylglycohydrolase
MTRKERKIAVSSLLFGLAVGDALGVPVEFLPRGSFRAAGMRGYGTHNQPPGTWSDDTSLTLCLADSLSRGFSPDDIARNFINWYDEGAFTAHGTVFDIGMATSKAINRLKAGVAPEKAGCAEANENGNGSLMRIAPLVFYLAGRPEAERFNITKVASSITHRDAILKAVNLGEDTDTMAAVTGSMAGLAYGIKAIPTVWLESLAGYGEINRIAGTLAEALST